MATTQQRSAGLPIPTEAMREAALFTRRVRFTPPAPGNETDAPTATPSDLTTSTATSISASVGTRAYEDVHGAVAADLPSWIANF